MTEHAPVTWCSSNAVRVRLEHSNELAELELAGAVAIEARDEPRGRGRGVEVVAQLDAHRVQPGHRAAAS